SRDATFNTGAGRVSVVNSLFLQPDGKVVINNGTARLNTDGTPDSAFNPVVNWGPIVMQPDGKFLVGGLVRVNADWSVDASFNTGTRPDYDVNCVALQPNGKVLIGGEFSTINGTNRSGIARLNSDGRVDNSFVTNLTHSTNVWTAALQSDGKVLIGG